MGRSVEGGLGRVMGERRGEMDCSYSIFLSAISRAFWARSGLFLIVDGTLWLYGERDLLFEIFYG